MFIEYMDSEQILILEGILLDKECVICFKNFINIKDFDYTKFLEKIIKKYNLNEVNCHPNFEDDTTSMCYDIRHECLICKQSVCDACIESQDDNDGARVIDSGAMFDNGYTEEVYMKLSMADTGIITCPICRTKDYRQKITCKEFSRMIPNEILYDIKKRLK